MHVVKHYYQPVMHRTYITGDIVHNPAHLRFLHVPRQAGLMAALDDPIPSGLPFSIPGKSDEPDPVIDDLSIRIRSFVQ